MKTTIPTSDPILKEAVAVFILFKRLGYEAARKVEVFLFPNKPRPSRKVPRLMQIQNAGSVGIMLTHMGHCAVLPLGKLVDLKYEVFVERWKEATQAIEHDAVSPQHIQALFEGTYTYTQIENLVLSLIKGGLYDDTAPDKIKVINKQIKKGNLVEIIIPNITGAKKSVKNNGS